MSDAWIVMPVMAQPAYTEAAIADCLGQSRPCRLLVVNQGVETSFRERLERIAEDSDRMFLWSHQPPLPSLAATWNRALDFAWATGAREALVVNNDVRLAPNTLIELEEVMGHTDALLVSGVGVGPSQFTAGQLVLPVLMRPPDAGGAGRVLDCGGPDFSCFLISKTCHERFRFDEAFIPAYAEDLDMHRRMLLAGEGARIVGVNVPFLHYGSITLKTVDAKTRAAIEALTEKASRAYYRQKWGGPVNEERYRRAFDETSAEDHLTTPELMREVLSGQDDRRAEAR